MTRARSTSIALLLVACDVGTTPDAGPPADVCPERWTLEIPAAAEDLVRTDDALVAVGHAADRGWLGAIDPCSGELIGQGPAGDEGSALNAGAREGADVYAVGGSMGEGLLVRAAPSLDVAYAVTLGDPAPAEALSDVASTGGALYAVGDAVDGASRAWMIRVGADGAACPIALVGRHARALAVTGDAIYVAVSDASEVVLHRFSAAACGACDCAPAWSSAPIPIADGEPTVTGLVVAGGEAYLGGYVIAGPGAGAALLARVDLASGAAVRAGLDPTDGVDGFVDLVLDDDLLLAVGATGWAGDPGFASATGVLAAFERDFTESATPVVVLEPAGMRLVSAFVSEGSAGFLLAGLAGEGTGLVTRCLRAADGCDGALRGDWPGAPPPRDAGAANDAGSAVSDAGPGRAGPPAIDPRDPLRLVRDGAPWYPTGYYPGAALNMTGPDFGGDFRAYDDHLVDRLASEGIDLFRVWVNWGALTFAPAASADQWDAHVLTPYARTGSGDAIDGQPRLDLDVWNEAWFTEVERTVSRAEAAGIVVQVLLLDCWHAGFGRSYGFEDYDFFAAGNNVNGLSFDSEAAWADVDGPIYARNTAFVEEVVRRLGHHDNVIWETCNEPRWVAPDDPAAVAAHPFHARLAARIHAVEAAQGHPRHLVVPVDLPEHRTVAGHRTPADRSAQSVEDFRAAALGQRAWGVPLISDNDCCPGEPSADLLRRKAWAALTAGAHLDVFNNEMFRRAVLDGMNTTLGMRWVSMPGRLVRERSVDLAGMTPCDASVTPTRWCYGHADGERILYVEGGGATTLRDAPTPADAVWMDPRTGARSDAGDGPTFTAPDALDWVLHVR